MTRAPKTKTGRCGFCNRRQLRRFLEWWDVIEEWRCKDEGECLKAAPMLDVGAARGRR